MGELTIMLGSCLCLAFLLGTPSLCRSRGWRWHRVGMGIAGYGLAKTTPAFRLDRLLT